MSMLKGIVYVLIVVLSFGVFASQHQPENVLAQVREIKATLADYSAQADALEIGAIRKLGIPEDLLDRVVHVQIEPKEKSCTGFLLRGRTVLTAGECIANSSDTDPTKINWPTTGEVGQTRNDQVHLSSGEIYPSKDTASESKAGLFITDNGDYFDKAFSTNYLVKPEELDLIMKEPQKYTWLGLKTTAVKTTLFGLTPIVSDMKQDTAGNGEVKKYPPLHFEFPKNFDSDVGMTGGPILVNVSGAWKVAALMAGPSGHMKGEGVLFTKLFDDSICPMLKFSGTSFHGEHCLYTFKGAPEVTAETKLYFTELVLKNYDGSGHPDDENRKDKKVWSDFIKASDSCLVTTRDIGKIDSSQTPSITKSTIFKMLSTKKPILEQKYMDDVCYGLPSAVKGNCNVEMNVRVISYQDLYMVSNPMGSRAFMAEKKGRTVYNFKSWNKWYEMPTMNESCNEKKKGISTRTKKGQEYLRSIRVKNYHFSKKNHELFWILDLYSPDPQHAEAYRTSKDKTLLTKDHFLMNLDIGERYKE